jgi:hypothetical protein
MGSKQECSRQLSKGGVVGLFVEVLFLVKVVCVCVGGWGGGR